MTDTLINILQWLIPGGGLGAVITWIVSRKIRKTRERKEVHDTYKTLYEDISGTLKNLHNEVDTLHKEIGRFRRAISKIYGCRYYPDCPVQRELQNGEGNIRKNSARESRRQPRIRDTTHKDNPCTRSESESGNSDTEPP